MMKLSFTHIIKIIIFLLFTYLSYTASIYAQNTNLGISEVSINSHYQVSYRSKSNPIPLNKIHQWILHIEDNEGMPVENAIVTIDGGMPTHNHGLPTQPIATKLGNGDYLVEGIKFSMTGAWDVWFIIQDDTVIDKVKFELEF